MSSYTQVDCSAAFEGMGRILVSYSPASLVCSCNVASYTIIIVFSSIVLGPVQYMSIRL